MNEYDVICVGAGLGGLATAIRAHDAGASVLILERSSMVGGVAAYSGGFVWVGNNHLFKGEDSIPLTEQYLDYIQGGSRAPDRTERRSYLEAAVRATSWFSDAGVPFAVIRNASDLYYPGPGSLAQGRLLEASLHGSDLGEWRSSLRPSPYYRTGVTRDESYNELSGDVEARKRTLAARSDQDFLTHGLGLAGAFVREALTERRIDCLLNQRVRKLLVDDGDVAGVEVWNEDGNGMIASYRAKKGVILATGGYGNAPDAAELEDVPALVEASPPVVDGDGLSLGQSVGASTTRGADPFVVLGARFLGQNHPGTEEPLYTQLLEYVGYPHSMIVNSKGSRFGDESYYGTMIRGLRQYSAHDKNWSNYPAWMIFDDTYRHRYPLGPFESGMQYSEDVISAATISDLSDKAGIDTHGLLATVDRFNSFAQSGIDEDFARGSIPFARQAYGDPDYANPNLGPIETGPFYAVPLKILGVGLSTLGLRIDSNARVLRRDGSCINGLYATGNAAATKELSAYVTGLANARNYTYGFLAAEHMCR